MQAILTPVAEAFHDLPEPRLLSCGITAHLVDPSHIQPARAWRLGRHDEIRRARHTGWYADHRQFEILAGYVYAFADETDDDNDEPPTTYYALVESNDTDCHYLDPDAYDDPVTAAHAADRMAELLAELERDCDAIRNRAIEARSQLAEANRVRREALGILRHVRACPADAEPLGPAFRRLWRQAAAGRRRAFDIVGEHRPPPCERPFDPERTATRDQCLADAWRDGWDCGAPA
ncbi:MAG: hypothetical protein OXH15_00630 [Gammaproteobacteria bacterium]|nr:hypothetical protein [Gammaproteobacteria bacterium]